MTLERIEGMQKGNWEHEFKFKKQGQAIQGSTRACGK